MRSAANAAKGAVKTVSTRKVANMTQKVTPLAQKVVHSRARLPKGGVKNFSRIDGVIQETLKNKGDIISRFTLRGNEALDAGMKFLGPNYRELGKPGTGVFRSADSLRQFRIDNNSILGRHKPNIPHVHMEIYKPNARLPHVNNHIPYMN